MDKITDFKISALTVKGFKGFGEQQSFQFGNMNVISGHNGQGKSSIADAIAYAIAGVPFFGAEANLDRLYTLGTKDVTVELTLKYADGSTHKLARSRVNDKTGITYDGVEVRQSNLNSMFGERDVFLSIFNPLYFIEELGEKGRNLLERYLPAIPHEQVMEKLCEQHRALLPQTPLHAPEFYQDQLRKDIRDIEKDIIYTEGQLDLLVSQNLANEETLSQQQTELARIEEAIVAYEAQRLDEALQEALQKNLAALLVQKEEIAKISAQLASVKTRYEQEKAILDKLKPGMRCSYCKQSITEQNIEDVKKPFAEKVNALLAEGRQLRIKLNELSGLDSKAQGLSTQEESIEVIRVALEYGELSAEQIADLQALRQKRQELLEKVSPLPTLPNTGSVEEKRHELALLKQSIAEKREIEEAVKFYIAQRSKLQFADFALLQHTKVVLYDVVKKTGEVKNIFRFSYDDKPYNCLSFSEKVKAGLEISELLKKLTGVNYPVFIDNGESVPVIDNIRPTGQVFVAQVIKAAPLSMRILDAPVAPDSKLAA